MPAVALALCRISLRTKTGQVCARIRGETNLQRHAGETEEREQRGRRRTLSAPKEPGIDLAYAPRRWTIKIGPAGETAKW